MHYNNYDQKMYELLNKGSFSKLNKNPTNGFRRPIYNTVKKLKLYFTYYVKSKLTH